MNLQEKTSDELLLSLIAEVAKSTNEIRCATTDLNKAANRINFSMILLNELKRREGDGSKD